MAFDQFGSVSVFRPSLCVEGAIRSRAQAHLRSVFASGEYRGEATVNRVLQHQFKIYDALLRSLIPKLGCRAAVEFFFQQYDESCRILHGNGILDLIELKRWEWIEPRMRRALKFLAELICMIGFTNVRGAENAHEAELVAEAALSCAENMVDLSLQSDLVHSIFPESCVLRIFDSGPYDFTVEIEGSQAAYNEEFSRRVVRDRNSRRRFVPWPQFDNHTRTHQRFLDGSFLAEFGLTYGEFIATLGAIINDSQISLHPNAFPTLFVNRTRVVDELSRSGWPRTAVERAIDGFSITQQNLLSEQRAVWKPKQEGRALRRGFFVLSHEDGPHLAFSRQMARENLINLVNWVSYKRLPREWRTDQTEQGLQKLSHEGGKWFERAVKNCLNGIGIIGNKARTVIGGGTRRLGIPESIGDFDFIGYHPEQRMIIIAEAKMVMTGLEGAYWRDDLNEFVYRENSYAKQLRRKVDWINAQKEAVSRALCGERLDSIGYVMLTLYPCIARAFIPDFPCVSLTEFMLDYEECGRWPYEY